MYKIYLCKGKLLYRSDYVTGISTKILVPFSTISWLAMLTARFTRPSINATSDIDAMHSVATHPVQCKTLC